MENKKTPIAQDRLDVLERMRQYEIEGKFDQDTEINPPSRTLQPHEVDYGYHKLSSKIKNKIALKAGKKFFEGMLKNKAVIYEGCEGLENLKDFKGGAIITCNHFNPFDGYALQLALSQHFKKFNPFRIIREGNFFQPEPLGFLMKYGNTLPLSENRKTMSNCMREVKRIMDKGNQILIYPEQGMWWNYRKPRPLKSGAFHFAAKNMKPVIPCFITLDDADFVGGDGLAVQKYKVHILPMIYPDPMLTTKENIDLMAKENFEAWKQTYERVYGKKLAYTTKIAKEKKPAIKTVEEKKTKPAAEKTVVSAKKNEQQKPTEKIKTTEEKTL